MLMGEITADPLKAGELEDCDYAITPILLQAFEREGSEPERLAWLTEASGDRETIEFVWARET